MSLKAVYGIFLNEAILCSLGTASAVMTPAALLLGASICLAGVHATETCLVDLQGEVTGPKGCTPAWAEKDEALEHCFHECITARYKLEGGFDRARPQVANAHPQEVTTCSHPKRDISCPSIVLTCSKVFGEFPNACSGKADLMEFIMTVGRFYVAFYAFGNATADGGSEPALVTRVVADADTMCSGAYKFLRVLLQNLKLNILSTCVVWNLLAKHGVPCSSSEAFSGNLPWAQREWQAVWRGYAPADTAPDLRHAGAVS